MKTTKLATAAAVTLFLATMPAAMAKADKKDHGNGRGHDQGRNEDSMKPEGWNEQERGEINQQFARYDRNGDGIISRSEFPGSAADFDRLDRNRDGVLSQADRNVAPGHDQRQMRFRGMDQNGDGVISRGEWRGNDQSFRKHDRNRDGVLSGDELRGNGRDRDDR